MEILKIEDLSFSYPLCEKKALKNISFTVERGDFVTVCGATGSGKSTLMRMLKKELIPLGELTGKVYYKGKDLDTLSEKETTCSIGFVAQRPEEQIVTDKVWHELAFGLENMGLPKDVIRRRVSEMTCYFGIEDWFEKSVNELSGGQKQLLNLASVMVMQPDILILDEPTAQLDPIAASDFIATLSKLNRDLSLTVVITEHRLEDVIPAGNKLLAMENGEIVKYGETRSAISALYGNKTLIEGMPAAVRIFNNFEINTPCPLTVREGRDFIEKNFSNEIRSADKKEQKNEKKDAVLEFSDVYFRYERDLPDILRGLDFTVYENEIFCILGGNGSGKSTSLSAAAGINKPYSGNIKVFGKKIKDYKNGDLYKNCLSLLPQDVQTVFLKNTVKEELADVNMDTSDLPYDLSELNERHPYDISGGQQQLLALAKVLSTKPKLLLLDEPTKGLDAYAKKSIMDVLKKLRALGMTIVCVTHDVEFAADCADRCAMFFRGEITSCSSPKEFFSGNSFYTTAANRMTRGYYGGVTTVADAVEIMKKNGAATK
ncbi:MAG: energy-coupling factor ABC transporter ATP-binding protein [Clostridia bacterium]|nr:energy-coupling factor ABC transporter ATP-binding protein [Clostridia bacterium]